MSLQLNQFAMQPVVGQLDQSINPNIFSVRVGQAQATPLVPGQAIKLANTASPIPEVLAAAANDPIFGFICYSLKQATFNAGDSLTVAGHNTIMYMQANAAITQGAKVETIAASTTVTTALGTNTKAGFAYDKATSANQIFRVLIEVPSLSTQTS